MVKLSEKYTHRNKPFWKQAVIILIAGIVFYGGVYLALVAKKGDYVSLGSISENSIQYSHSK
jgi:hypothetical protein